MDCCLNEWLKVDAEMQYTSPGVTFSGVGRQASRLSDARGECLVHCRPRMGKIHLW